MFPLKVPVNPIILNISPTNGPEIELKLGKIFTKVLLDSGSDVNCLSKNFFEKYKSHLGKVTACKPDEGLMLKSASGLIIQPTEVQVTLQLGNKSVSENFYILEELPVPVLVGNATMKKNSRGYVQMIDNTGKTQIFKYLIPETNDMEKGRIFTIHAKENVTLPPGCEEARVGKGSYNSGTHTILVSGKGQTTNPYDCDIAAAKGIGKLVKGKTNIWDL